jgi:hypothetical protein
VALGGGKGPSDALRPGSWVLEGPRSAWKGMRKIRGEGEGYTPSDRPLLVVSRRAGTAVPSERKVVFGHAYAIPALFAASGGRCGYDKPTLSSVDGVDT